MYRPTRHLLLCELREDFIDQVRNLGSSLGAINSQGSGCFHLILRFGALAIRIEQGSLSPGTRLANFR